jgi:hypothetical protein
MLSRCALRCKEREREDDDGQLQRGPLPKEIILRSVHIGASGRVPKREQRKL